MNRKEELQNLINKNPDIAVIISPLIEKMLFLEPKMEELEQLPFIRVNPNHPYLQKPTPASKIYKELLQQYINVVKAVQSQLKSDGDEISPLNEWVKSRRGDCIK